MKSGAAKKPSASAGVGYREALGRIRTQPLSHPVVLMQTDVATQCLEVWRLLTRTLDESARDFNLSTLTCSPDTGAGDVEALGEELPIMADRRYVWIRDVHRLHETQAERVGVYLASASPQTTFLISASKRADESPAADGRREGGAEGARERSDETARGASAAADAEREGAQTDGSATRRRNGFRRIVDIVGDLGFLINAETGSPEDLKSGLESALEERGLTADTAARTALIERSAGNLSTLMNEIEKLTCFAGPQGRFSADDVRALTHDDARRLSWDVTHAMENGRTAEALRLLARVLETDTHPLAFLGWLSTRYRQLIRVRGMMDARASQEDIRKALGISPKDDWKVRKRIDEARAYRLTDLETAIELLLEADVALKTGSRHDRLVLELLVVRLVPLVAKGRS